MASAILSNLLGKLEGAGGEIARIDEDAMKVKVRLHLIEPFLQDADLKQIDEKPVKDWMGRLKDVMYDADDVLDEWYTRFSISQANDSSVTIESCSDGFGNEEIARALNKIVDRLDALIREKDQLNLVTMYQNQEYIRPRLLTTSLVDMSMIFGRDTDRKIIVNLLFGRSREEIQVISIVGMCGLGKTTLAQLIYNGDALRDFYDLRMWVCVSEQFDLRRVAMDITEQATGKAQQNIVSLEFLLQCLRSSVERKRFLLVLDDVWSEERNHWTLLKLALDVGAPGSTILITTRNEGVALMTGSIYTHKLGQLSDDDCWSLFSEIAYSGRSVEEYEGLLEIGKDIFEKCKGVPFAVKHIASLLRSKRTRREWRSILQSENWDLQIVKSLSPALLLSYYGLPPYLRPCFMYWAIFPRDVIIKKDELVKLWMAEGFLGSDEEMDLEEIGEKYFEELAMHSFFQDSQKNRDGKIFTCRVHDLLHVLALLLTDSLGSILERSETQSSIHYFRHMNAYNVESPSILKLKNLRSLIFRASESTLSEVCRQLKVLRLLDLSYANLKELPSEIESLSLLRYLDLSWNTALKDLPESVCNLYNLQTLKLIGCRSLRKLPEGLGKLSKLRHLEIQETEKMYHFPQSIGNLGRLRTLCKFLVSDAVEGCRIGELGRLIDLRNTLKITGLRHVKDADEAIHAGLHKKIYLSRLELDFGFSQVVPEDLKEENVKEMEGVLKYLQPSVYLEELVINDYSGFKFSSWMESKSLLPNLVTVELKECKNCILLPALGSLESLEFLVIDGLESVTHVGAEFYGAEYSSVAFPKLKHLEFCGMKEWVYWEIPFLNFYKVMPYLCEIELDECPKLMGLPALGELESLERLEASGLDSVKYIGPEFYGVNVGTSFPELKTFKLYEMEEWKGWEIPFAKFKNVMPCLFDLQISNCPKLMGIPDLGQLKSLGRMELGKMSSVTRVGTALGILSDGHRRIISGVGSHIPEVVTTSSGGNGDSTEFALSARNVVLFQRLTFLKLWDLPEWDEELEETTGTAVTSTVSVQLHLEELSIRSCPRLKVVPNYFFSHSLRKLVLLDCPQLMGMQSCLPPLLEELNLYDDVGELSKSLFPIITHDDKNNNTSYPYLKFVKIFGSLHSSLPQGLSRFTSLKELQICQCNFLDFKLKDELRYFSMLELLDIIACPIIKERCSREEWGNNLSHQIPFKIIIDHEKI